MGKGQWKFDKNDSLLYLIFKLQRYGVTNTDSLLF